jgi:Icc-related predicted phosphoesterase
MLQFNEHKLSMNQFENHVEILCPSETRVIQDEHLEPVSIILISDIHNYQHLLTLPKGDLLLIAGDMTNMGKRKELERFSTFLSSVKPNFEMIVVVAGNHEVSMDTDFFNKVGKKYFYGNSIDPKRARAYFIDNPDVVYLEDSGVEYKGIKIWGTPWVNPCGNWAFCLNQPGMDKQLFGQIPEDTDILISHSPPYGILDVVPMYSYQVDPQTNKMVRKMQNQHTGNKELMKRVHKIKPKLHVFGHIHECSGAEIHGDTLFVNAAILNHRHKPENLPKKVILHFKVKEK